MTHVTLGTVFLVYSIVQFLSLQRKKRNFLSKCALFSVYTGLEIILHWLDKYLDLYDCLRIQEAFVPEGTKTCRK